ncbi:MAG: HIT domain-containing protein, partial [Muribaculaceae bacterium]|nr:HIT domain-containing protein [Muribaculaceae bacterium]
MASIFSRIIAGEILSYRVAEDEKHYAFLDINPLSEGHTLVVPKREVDYIFDLDDAEYADLQLFAKRVAAAIEKSVSCKRIGVAVIGLEVPHAHIHLVPITSEADMD